MKISLVTFFLQSVVLYFSFSAGATAARSDGEWTQNNAVIFKRTTFSYSVSNMDVAKPIGYRAVGVRFRFGFANSTYGVPPVFSPCTVNSFNGSVSTDSSVYVNEVLCYNNWIYMKFNKTVDLSNKSLRGNFSFSVSTGLTDEYGYVTKIRELALKSGEISPVFVDTAPLDHWWATGDRDAPMQSLFASSFNKVRTGFITTPVTITPIIKLDVQPTLQVNGATYQRITTPLTIKTTANHTAPYASVSVTANPNPDGQSILLVDGKNTMSYMHTSGVEFNKTISVTTKTRSSGNVDIGTIAITATFN